MHPSEQFHFGALCSLFLLRALLCRSARENGPLDKPSRQFEGKLTASVPVLLDHDQFLFWSRHRSHPVGAIETETHESFRFSETCSSVFEQKRGRIFDPLGFSRISQ